MRYLTFALAKGRLADQAMELFEKIGLPCQEMKEGSRKLIFTNEEQKLRFFLSKPSDVPTYVEYGAADIGPRRWRITITCGWQPNTPGLPGSFLTAGIRRRRLLS